MSSVLPLSTVVNVSVVATPVLPSIPNVNVLAIITQDATPGGWAGGQAFAKYTFLSAVGTDFGVTSNTYAIASAFFAQNPNPLAAGGYLVVIPRLQSPSLETVVACLTRTQTLVSYFGFVIDQELTVSAPSTFSAIAAYAQSNNLMFFYTSSNANDANSGSPFDLLRQAGDVNSRYSYYGGPLLNGSSVQQTQIFAAAYASRALSVNYNGSDTVITMNLKQLVNIPADSTLTSTIYNAAQLSGTDVYANVASFVALLTSGANSFTDQITNQFWLQFDLQTQIFDVLAGTNTKIPLTEQGMNQIKNAINGVFTQGVNNGFLAPGAWPVTAPVFGDTQALIRNIADAGFYTYSSPVSGLTASQRNARQAPLIQCACLSAGAIHSVTVNVNVQL